MATTTAHMKSPRKRSTLLSPRGDRRLMNGLKTQKRSISVRRMRKHSSSSVPVSGGNFAEKHQSMSNEYSSGNILTMSRSASRDPPKPTLSTREMSPSDREGIIAWYETSDCDDKELLNRLMGDPMPDSCDGDDDESADGKSTSSSVSSISDPLSWSPESTVSDEDAPFPGIPLWRLSDKVRVRQVTQNWSRPPAPPLSQKSPEHGDGGSEHEELYKPEPAPKPNSGISEPERKPEPVPESEPQLKSEPEPAPESEPIQQPEIVSRGRSDTVTKLLVGIVSSSHENLKVELQRVREEHKAELIRVREDQKAELRVLREKLESEREEHKDELHEVREELENERECRDEVDEAKHRLELETQKLSLEHARLAAEISATVSARDLAVLENDRSKTHINALEERVDELQAHEEHFSEITKEHAKLTTENALLRARMRSCPNCNDVPII